MGIFKLNGIDYMGGGGGGNTNYEELTQLEYDALTEEEKNNGTIYFITDTNSNQDGKFQPIIYSEEEREIGVWTDGKPLYQKTAFVTPENTISMVGLSLKYGQCYSINTSGGIASVPYNDGSYTVWWMSNDTIRFATQHNISQYVITYQYTKDSDSPGSGQWTPQGVPAVHYDGDEKVMGTWFGETLYEKSYHVSSLSTTYQVIDSNITSSNAKIRDCKIGGYKIGGGYNNAQYANGFVSSSIFSRVILAADGVRVGMEGSFQEPITDFDFTIRYTKTTS